jgi:hypothetical protein
LFSKYHSQAFGEVDPKFANDFDDVLFEDWCIADIERNVWIVKFRKSNTKPVITDGWVDIRKFYGWKGGNEVMLTFYGKILFHTEPL